jgi:hypothetical protein
MLHPIALTVKPEDFSCWDCVHAHRVPYTPGTWYDPPEGGYGECTNPTYFDGQDDDDAAKTCPGFTARMTEQEIPF